MWLMHYESQGVKNDVRCQFSHSATKCCQSFKRKPAVNITAYLITSVLCVLKTHLTRKSSELTSKKINFFTN